VFQTEFEDDANSGGYM